MYPLGGKTANAQAIITRFLGQLRWGSVEVPSPYIWDSKGVNKLPDFSKGAKRLDAMPMFGIASNKVHVEPTMKSNRNRRPVVSCVLDMWAGFVDV